MATIVRSAKNPWWTPLAVNVLGGLWNKWQENEANRKANAFKGQLAQDLAALAGGTQQNGLTDSTQGNIFNMQNEPEGYNADGWARAFHNTDSPLTQFDFGTNNIVPQNAAPQNTAVQNAAPRSLTAMDIYNAVMTRAAQKRFSHLSPQSINDMANSYIKMNEDARQERRRQEAADAYLNAGNDIDRLNSLYGGAIRGDIPQSVLTSGQELYKYNNPDLQRFAHNAGDRTYFYNWNPRTGQYNQAGEFANTPTPQQSFENQLALMREAEQQRRFNVQQENWERRFRHDTQPTYTMRAMGDGKLYWVDNRGSTIAPVTDGNGNHMDALPSEAGANTLSEAEKAYFREMENITKGLRNEISGLQRRREKAESTEYPEIDRQLKAKQDELNRLNAERDARLQSILTRSSIGTRSQTTPPSNGNGQTTNGNTQSQPHNVGVTTSVASNMLGLSKPAEPRSKFGAPRPRGRKHMGVDIAVGRGTPILAPDIGTPMTVKHIGSDPRHSYGNHVVLEGKMTDKDGKQHTIEMTIAHIDNGTIGVQSIGQKVNAGTLLGKVGNTGNTSDRSKLDKNGDPMITTWYEGKNSGYHLHLETKIDGKHVDPEKFNELIEPYVAYSRTLQPNSFVGVTPFQKSTAEHRLKETTLAYKNPRTGDEISQADIDEAVRKAENGELEHAHSAKEVHEKLRKEGYISAEEWNAQNTQTQPTTTSRDITPGMATNSVVPSVTPNYAAHYSSLPPYLTGRNIYQPKLSVPASIPTSNDVSATTNMAMTSPSVFPERSPEMQAALANLNGDNNI